MGVVDLEIEPRASGPRPGNRPESDRDPPPLSLGEVWVAVKRRRRLVVGTLLVTAATVSTVLLLLRNYYTSSISLVPEARSVTGAGAGQLGGLAALAGLNLGSLGPGQSPQFYAAVLQSRPLFYAVVMRRFPAYGVDGRRGVTAADSARLVDVILQHDRRLFDYLRPPRSAADSLARAAKRLEQQTDVSVDLKSGIVHLSVSYWNRFLASDIANAYAEELLRFNAETRQTQAHARRVFLDGRVAQSEQDLAAAQAAVRTFLERNRTYENSPSLRFEYSNLQRALTVQQELYLDLRRQLDAARVAEVDDVPALSIIEGAVPAQRKSSPNRTLYLLMILALTAVTITTAAAVIEYRDRLFPSRSPGEGP